MSCRPVLSVRLAVAGFMVAALAGCAGFSDCGLRECPADAKITGEVRTLLAGSPGLGPPNLISIQTVRGMVFLRGLVSSPYQVAEAGSIAAGAPGVISVQNLLYIDNAH